MAQFYANLEDKDSELQSIVNGHKFTITPNYLSKSYRLLSGNIDLNHALYDSKDWSHDDIFKTIFLPQTNPRSKLYLNNLNHCACMVAKVLSRNLI